MKLFFDYRFTRLYSVLLVNKTEMISLKMLRLNKKFRQLLMHTCPAGEKVYLCRKNATQY
jgi:hypothetical protein